MTDPQVDNEARFTDMTARIANLEKELRESKQHLQAALVTIEALKERVVDLNFQIVDLTSARIADYQQGEVAPAPVPPVESGEGEVAT